MTFDAVAFVNILISSLIGVAAGWLISHWYFMRAAPVERILKELKRVLPYYLHPVRYPQFYAPSAVRVDPVPPPPQDTDIPHLTHAICTRQSVQPGSRFEVLFAIVDTGRNFDNPAGLSLRDHLGRDVPAEFSGLGLASAVFTAAANQDQAVNTITIVLRDTSGKEYRQTLSLPITS